MASTRSMRLMSGVHWANAMDDLKVVPDNKRSVRNTADRIIQFSYGEDGIDPCRSAHGSPVNIDVIVEVLV